MTVAAAGAAGPVGEHAPVHHAQVLDENLHEGPYGLIHAAPPGTRTSGTMVP